MAANCELCEQFGREVLTAGNEVVVHETARGDVVVIERGHIHSHHCGHYFHRGHWYVAHGHVHGHGCGHFHRDGIWVVVD